MNDKNMALRDFLSMYPWLYGGWLYFNVLNQRQREMSLMTDSDNILDTFIDGSERREYTFAVVMMKDYDSGTSDINISAMDEAQNFNAWIKQQDEQEYYPDWENCKISEMRVLTNVPILSVDQDANIAQYFLQLSIHYVQEKI